MIVCILWQHRLAIRHVHPQRGLFFAPEADSVLAITQKKEGWQLQLSDTLQFLASPRRCRLISRRHDELCYLPFYEKIDLFYTFDETGFNQYTLYQRPQGCWMLNDQRLSEPCGDQDEPWAILDFDQNLAKETTQFPGMIVNGVHQRQTRLEAGMQLKIKLKPLRRQALADWMYQPPDKLPLPFHPTFQFYPVYPRCTCPRAPQSSSDP